MVAEQCVRGREVVGGCQCGVVANRGECVAVLWSVGANGGRTTCAWS